MFCEALLIFLHCKIEMEITSISVPFNVQDCVEFCAIGKPFFFLPAGRVTLQFINNVFAKLFIECVLSKT